jgi:hypothetical protein
MEKSTYFKNSFVHFYPGCNYGSHFSYCFVLVPIKYQTFRIAVSVSLSLGDYINASNYTQAGH